MLYIDAQLKRKEVNQHAEPHNMAKKKPINHKELIYLSAQVQNYITAHNMSELSFARRCGVDQKTINRIITYPNASTYKEKSDYNITLSTVKRVVKGMNLCSFDAVLIDSSNLEVPAKEHITLSSLNDKLDSILKLLS